MRIEHNDNAVIVFERSENDFFLGDELKDISVGKLKNTMSILSFISLNYDNEIIKQIIDWFFSISILDFDNTQYSAENREGRRVLILKCVFNYEKSDKDIYDKLKDKMQTAIMRTKKQYESYDGMPPSQCCPATRVYELVDELQKYS